MRTPRRKVNPKTGETYWTIRYRNPPGRDGVDRSLSFHGEKAEQDAAYFADLLNRLGAPEAVAWWNKHLDDEASGHGETLDAWWPRYLRSLTGITDGTRDAYDRTYKRVWQEPLGSRPLGQITRADIAAVINDLSQGHADKTVHNAYGVITSCFKTAQADGLIPSVPTRNIRLPRRTAHEDVEMRFLTHEEWARLYDAMTPHYRPLLTFLTGTGARWGEAEALTVGDIVAGAVRITKASKWNASSATRDIGPTKTRRSRRTVTLPPEVVDELAPLLDGRARTDRLFLAVKGGPLRHKTVWLEWREAVQKAELEAPAPRIHDLRHTHVAWLIAAGIPLPVIQARLGHEHISTTIDRYGHLLPDLQIAAANAASVALRGGPLQLEG